MRSEIKSRNQAFTNAPVIGKRAIAELNAQYLAAGITEFREETIEFYRIALKE